MTIGDVACRNRTAILGTTALLVAAGALAAWSMPVAIFPEVAFHRVTVIARAGDLPVEQTLTAVTQRLENAMAGVLGVQTIRSMTTRGGAQLDLVFGWNHDMVRGLQMVQAALEETRSALPPGTDLEARLLDTSAFPIVGVAVSAPQRSLAQLSDFAIYEAAPQLRTIADVYRVELNGAKIREYDVTVDPAALAAHHLDLAAVEAAVHSANTVAAAGLVRDGGRLALTVVRGDGTRAQALPDVVVARDRGIPVTLGAVAQIDAGLREDFIRTAADGETAVLLGISRQPDGNTLAISAGVRERIAALQQAHPDYRFSIFYDQADLVRDAIGSVRDSIAIGLLLAVAVVFFFIADLRATAVAAAVIPATVLITCIALRALGMGFNLMTLGGIAAGIGLILDDAIVVVENVHRHRLLGQRGEEAVRASLGEIARALLGSTLTPVAVLLPLGLLSAVPGAFFRPLAVTMSAALLVSLALALTFTPALAAAVERGAAGGRSGGPGDRLAARLSRFYARALRWALRHPWTAAPVAAALLLGTMVAYEHVETGFVPAMDEGAFVLDYWSPPGTSLQETERMLRVVDQILRDTPEVGGFARRTGAEMGFFLTETNRGDYAVRLRRGRRRSADEVMDGVRDAIHAQLPGLRVDFAQILQDMIGDLSGTPSPIEIKLFGNDEAALRQAAVATTGAIASIPGVVDRFDGITEVGPTFQVEIDDRRAALAGLDAALVQHWLETAITGTVVGQVLEASRAVPLRVRAPSQLRDRLDLLADLTMVTPRGGLAPIRAFARLAPGRAAVQRHREDLRQLVRVTARLDGRDLGSGMRDVQRALGGIALPAGVTVEYGGLYASQQQAFAELLLVFFGSLACVSALLLVEFGSLAAVAAIVAGSSLALSGSLAALWLTGTALNVSSIVGLIMVVGIVAKNGILLLDFAGRALARRVDLETALIDAGSVRLRPILMTSLAAAAGLAPLAFGIGAGGQMQQPLAIAILGGLSVSTLFSLIGVPLLYALLARPAGGDALHPHAAPHRRG
jgi:CzcA family heavy metal efflux pump